MGVLLATRAIQRKDAQFRSYFADGLIAMPARILITNTNSPANSALI